jgi:hypothetical protein
VVLAAMRNFIDRGDLASVRNCGRGDCTLLFGAAEQIDSPASNFGELS